MWVVIIIILALFFIMSIVLNNKEKANQQKFKSSSDKKDDRPEALKIIERTQTQIEEIKSVLEQNFFQGYGGNINVAIKGLYYRNAEDIKAARDLRYNSPVFLKREKDNPVDNYAVAVYTETGHHIGYVPKEYSKGIIELIEQGFLLNAYITKNSYGEIPYLYMDIDYKSKEQQEFETNSEKELIARFNKMGLQETCKLRWQYYWGNLKPNIYDRTIEISASYGETEFRIKEKLESKDGKIKEIEYIYNENVGCNNCEIAERLEKANEIENAILKYESNIDIEECIAKSALRLSVLYKKVNRHKDIVPMLQTSLDKVRKQHNTAGIHKLENRLNLFLNNESFKKKYLIEDK